MGNDTYDDRQSFSFGPELARRQSVSPAEFARYNFPRKANACVSRRPMIVRYSMSACTGFFLLISRKLDTHTEQQRRCPVPVAEMGHNSGGGEANATMLTVICALFFKPFLGEPSFDD